MVPFHDAGNPGLSVQRLYFKIALRESPVLVSLRAAECEEGEQRVGGRIPPTATWQGSWLA